MDGSKLASNMQKSKRLARVIKSKREPPWPSPLLPDLPQKSLADELIDCYLRTTETVYRVLHVPTFTKDYEAIWMSESQRDIAFLVQVKLVLAIGATVYDEQFTLRPLAIRWVYEAQTWLAGPGFKSRLCIQSLQTNVLLLIARETADVDESLVWISAGALLRTAVYMGLHRDPSKLPNMSILAAEMHRRIFNTIIEITLQSSIGSGGPPLIALDDFDTESPLNFEDDQLITDDPVPKAESELTSTSVTIALRKSLAIRLAVAKFLNALGSSGTYEETLRLDAELRESYRTLCRVLQGYSLNSGLTPSPFAMRMVDVLMRRFLLSLHVPFYGQALHETAYAYSRKIVTDNALQIWRATFPSSLTSDESRSDTAPVDQIDLARLTTCGTGQPRTAAWQASALIVVELRALLQEDGALSPTTVRPDLVSILYEAKAWSWRCIEAGETSIKGYMMMALLVAQIEGLIRRTTLDELPLLMVKAAEEAEERCITLLEQSAARGQTDTDTHATNQSTFNTPFEMMGDWDFLVGRIIPYCG